MVLFVAGCWFMDLEEVISLVLAIGPGSYGKYRIEKYYGDSYFDILVEDVDDASLVMQFSVDDADGRVWSIGISDFDCLNEFVRFLDCIRLYVAVRERLPVDINHSGKVVVFDGEGEDVVAEISCGRDSFVVSWVGGSCLIPRGIDVGDVVDFLFGKVLGYE